MAINGLRNSHVVIASAWLIHAVSWFLPVVRLDIFGPIRGWTAFGLALSPILQGSDRADTWYNLVLPVVSAVTTFLFIVGSPLVVWRASQSVRRACAWVATFAFLLNSHWYILSGSDRKELSVGYFFWWFSFILLAIGLFGISSGSKFDEYDGAIPANGKT
jgi:hypothetical protein